MARRFAAAIGLCAALAVGWSVRGGGPATLPLALQRTDWGTYGFDNSRDGFSPDPSITPGVVSRFHLLWSVPLGAVTITQPLFAGNVDINGRPVPLVFIGTEYGDLVAVDAADGRVVWERSLGSVQTNCYDMPGDIFGISGTPVIDRAAGRIYVADSNGIASSVDVHALDLADGVEEPGWPVRLSADPRHNNVWGALSVDRGTVYATMASLCDFAPSFGRVMAIDARTARIRASWAVVHDHEAILGGGGIWGYGGASVDPETGDVFVATGNALEPAPESQPYAESVVRLSRDLHYMSSHHPDVHGMDVDFGSTPTLFHPPGCPPELAVENKAGALFVYRRDAVADGPVQTLQLTQNSSLEGLGIFIGLPAYWPASRMLFVADPGPDVPAFEHGMLAFRVGPDCRLEPAWHTPYGREGQGPVSTPTVVGGVVFYGDGAGASVVAFDAASGVRIWDSGRTIGGPVFAPPVAVNGRLYVAAWDKGGTGGHLYAFGP